MDSASMNQSPAHETSVRRPPGRPKMNSYTDLLKPGESREAPDAAERRKIQNRLAQRAYRRNLRDRTKEVEKLKNQVKELQQAMTTTNGSAAEPDENAVRTSSQESESLGDEDVGVEQECQNTCFDNWPDISTPEQEMLRQYLNWPTNLEQELRDCFGKDSDASIDGSAPVSSMSSNMSIASSSGTGHHSVSLHASEAHEGFHSLGVDDSVYFANSPSSDTIADAQRMVFPRLQPAPCVDEPLIHLAIRRGTVNSLKLLLNSYPLLVNVRDKAGYTPLQRAIISGKTDMMSLLIEHGADPV